MPQSLLHLTANIIGVAKHEMLEGQDHLVAPMVMMTEGVHAGSNGALYYSESELSRHPDTWNGKPIVVYHPMVNGMGVSACSPDVFNSRKVGTVMNAEFVEKGKKLKAEAWLNVERLEAVDPRVLENVESDTPM